MKLLITALAIYFSLSVCAQDATIKDLRSEATRTVQKDIDDTTQKSWTHGGNVNINGTQGSLKNWAAGGDKFSMALNSNIHYSIFYKKKKINWDNTVDFNFGYLQSSSLGSLKNDDRLDLLSKYGYNFSGKCYLTELVSLRTQLFDGYTISDNDKTFSSSFFSPGYLIVSSGVDYKPSANLSVYVSPITTRFTIVAQNELSKQGLYGVPAGKHAITDVGAFSIVNWTKTINKNISYRGRMDLFSNYHKNPENVDIYVTNYFSFKISKSFTASYSLDLIYDDDVRQFGPNGNSPGLQLKSLIGLGFQMKLK